MSESEDEVMRVPRCILANTLQDRWESNTLYQDYLGNEHEVVLSDATTESENEALRIPAIKELEESPEFTTVASRWAARWARPGSAAREYLQAEYNPDDIALREWEVGLNNEQAMNVLTMSQDIEDVYMGKTMFMHLYNLAGVGSREPSMQTSVSDVSMCL